MIQWLQTSLEVPNWMPSIAYNVAALVGDIFPESATDKSRWRWGKHLTGLDIYALVVTTRQHPLTFVLFHFSGERVNAKWGYEQLQSGQKNRTYVPLEHDFPIDDVDSYVGWLSLARTKQDEHLIVYQNMKRISLWCPSAQRAIRLEKGVYFTWNPSTWHIQVIQPDSPSSRRPLGDAFEIRSAVELDQYRSCGQFEITGY